MRDYIDEPTAEGERVTAEEIRFWQDPLNWAFYVARADLQHFTDPVHSATALEDLGRVCFDLHYARARKALALVSMARWNRKARRELRLLR